MLHGHLLTENRNALIVDAAFTHATGTAERDAALAMLDRRKRRRRVTLGADKAYDVSAFAEALRSLKVTPHITADGHLTKTGKGRKTRINGRTTRHTDYGVSQRIRKQIEEGFGWIKAPAGLAKTRHRGLAHAGWMFTLTAAACKPGPGSTKWTRSTAPDRPSFSTTARSRSGSIDTSATRPSSEPNE